jgi:hypothetical protein
MKLNLKKNQNLKDETKGIKTSDLKRNLSHPTKPHA